MPMSKWEEYGLVDMIRVELRNVLRQAREGDHKFDPPFITAYQLAIALVEQDQDLCEKLGMPLGGKDSGEGETLARYLANQLSRRIQEGEIEDIEGAFLSVKSIKHLAFTQDVVATATEPFSLFRLKIE